MCEYHHTKTLTPPEKPNPSGRTIQKTATNAQAEEDNMADYMLKQKRQAAVQSVGAIQRKGQLAQFEDNRPNRLQGVATKASVQRQTDDEQSIQRKDNDSHSGTVNGISSGWNSAYTQMFGYSPHAIGITARKVSSSHPELTRVGARSLTQGNNILYSDSRDFGHEMVHGHQQATQRIAPDTTINGQPVNTNKAHEQEADDKGQVMRNLANSR